MQTPTCHGLQNTQILINICITSSTESNPKNSPLFCVTPSSVAHPLTTSNAADFQPLGTG